MDSELLQSFVRAGDAVAEEPEPSRLYQSPKPGQNQQKTRTKSEKSDSNSQQGSTQPRWKRREKVVIEQRFIRTDALAIDECYCDKDRAAAVSFGYLDIKYELKAKNVVERHKQERITPDDDSMAFYVFAMKEIKARNLENGMKFITKVDSSDSC